MPAVSVVVPNWNGLDWLPQCIAALREQTLAPAEVIVVDNGSTDGSLAYLASGHPEIRVIALDCNTGFAHAANRGIRAARHGFVALINTDVVLADDWLQRVAEVLSRHAEAASVACKMLSLEDQTRVYDAGDVLRRDGVCEQRGRFARDDGRWDSPGEVFGACAGAAMFRRDAILAVGGFDERYFAYLEDVDLALRLRMAGWHCRYEPVVALHAGEGSSHQLRSGYQFLVTRNTILLIVKSFPIRWLPLVAYRQLAWTWHAAGERRICTHVRALFAAAPLIRQMWRERRRLAAHARVPVTEAIPPRAFRGPRAGGHPAQIAENQKRLRL